jgi:hypothetical protein
MCQQANLVDKIRTGQVVATFSINDGAYTIVLDDKENLKEVVLLVLVRIVHASTQDPLHNVSFVVVFRRTFTPKNLYIIIIVYWLICNVSMKCQIILNITSTYITSVIHSNVHFLPGAFKLEAAHAMATMALSIRGVIGG